LRVINVEKPLPISMMRDGWKKRTTLLRTSERLDGDESDAESSRK